MSDARYYKLQGKLFRVRVVPGLFDGETETYCDLIDGDWESSIDDDRHITRVVLEGTPVDEQGDVPTAATDMHPLQAVLEQGVLDGWAEKLPAEGGREFGFRSDKRAKDVAVMVWGDRPPLLKSKNPVQSLRDYLRRTADFYVKWPGRWQ